jgi:hypothetical protein
MRDEADERCAVLCPNAVLYGLWALGYFSVFAFLPILDSGARPEDMPSHCNFNFTARAMGADTDVLFLYTTQWAPGLELAVRSFRSTCLQCRIVVFVGPQFKANDWQAALLKNLNVDIVRNCGNLSGRLLIPHMFRYECILEYMDEHPGIQRVFHSDAHDVFFQGSPFASGLPSDRLLFVVEPHCIRTCGWNLAWISGCYGTSGRQLSNRFIVCSGSIGGSASEFRKLIELMISQPAWKHCWDVSLDQPIVNYLMWTGEIDKHGIQYAIGGCESGMYTMQWCTYEKQVRMNSDNVIISQTGHPPFFLHQYNRIENLTAYLFEKCNVRANE